jgi:hypothetical protein
VDSLSSTAGTVAAAGCVIALAALIIGVVALVRLRRLRADQRVVIGDAASAQDLVAHAANLHREHVALNAYVEDVARGLDARLATAENRLDGAITHTSLVRYDAYNEMSGHQSTTLALLDTRSNGVVISSIHHRDQARIYVKQIRGGQGELTLSPEEEQAIRLALKPTAG